MVVEDLARHASFIWRGTLLARIAAATKPMGPTRMTKLISALDVDSELRAGGALFVGPFAL